MKKGCRAAMTSRVVITILLLGGVVWGGLHMRSAKAQAPALPLAYNCGIEFFDASPGSPVNIGTHVSLHGKGRCDGGVRAARFTIDGQPRAEIGAPEQTETWKTEEFSSGNHEVCFVVAANGDNNWDAPARSCKNYEVKGSPPPPPEIKCYVDSFGISSTSVTPGTRVQLSGSGHCDGAGVRAVRFSIDGQPWGEFGGPSTSGDWDTSSVGEGSHQIGFHVAAFGDDNWSKQGVAYKTVTIQQSQPVDPHCRVVSFAVDPASAAPGTKIHFSGEGACENGQVRAVRFSIDGQPWGEFGGPSTSGDWDTQGLGEGSHQIGFHVAAVGDNNWEKQAVAYKTVTLQNNNPPPPPPSPTNCRVVSFSVNPSSGQPGARIHFAGEGACDDGQLRAVRFSIDGQPWGEFGGPSTSGDWDTQGVSEGEHRIGFHVAAVGDNDWSRQAVSYKTVSLHHQVVDPTEVKPPASVACRVVSFSVSPETAAPGTKIHLSGEGSCDNGQLRAVRFSIGGTPWGEFGGPATSGDWDTAGFSEGKYTIGFHVAAVGDDDWSDEAVSTRTVNLTTSPPPATEVPSSTSVPQNFGTCRVDQFEVTPDQGTVETVITLHGKGSCTGPSVRAVRFMIDGSPYGEIGAPEQKITWQGQNTGSHTMTFQVVASGQEWDRAASLTRTITIKSGTSPNPEGPIPGGDSPTINIDDLTGLSCGDGHRSFEEDFRSIVKSKIWKTTLEQADRDKVVYHICGVWFPYPPEKESRQVEIGFEKEPWKPYYGGHSKGNNVTYNIVYHDYRLIWTDHERASNIIHELEHILFDQEDKERNDEINKLSNNDKCNPELIQLMVAQVFYSELNSYKVNEWIEKGKTYDISDPSQRNALYKARIGDKYLKVWTEHFNKHYGEVCPENMKTKMWQVTYDGESASVHANLIDQPEPQKSIWEQILSFFHLSS